MKKGEKLKFSHSELRNIELEHTKATQATILMELFEPAALATSLVPSVRFSDASAAAHILTRKRIFLTGRIAWLFTCAYAEHHLSEAPPDESILMYTLAMYPSKVAVELLESQESLECDSDQSSLKSGHDGSSSSSSSSSPGPDSDEEEEREDIIDLNRTDDEAEGGADILGDFDDKSAKPGSNAGSAEETEGDSTLVFDDKKPRMYTVAPTLSDYTLAEQHKEEDSAPTDASKLLLEVEKLKRMRSDTLEYVQVFQDGWACNGLFSLFSDPGCTDAATRMAIWWRNQGRKPRPADVPDTTWKGMQDIFYFCDAYIGMMQAEPPKYAVTTERMQCLWYPSRTSQQISKYLTRLAQAPTNLPNWKQLEAEAEQVSPAMIREGKNYRGAFLISLDLNLPKGKGGPWDILCGGHLSVSGTPGRGLFKHKFVLWQVRFQFSSVLDFAILQKHQF